MKMRFLLLAAAPLILGACNQDQAKLLQMRDEFQRQLDAKDKQIEELTRKVADNKGGGGGGVDADALAAKLSPTISKAVAQETAQQLAEIKQRLEAIDKALGQGHVATSVPATPTVPTPGVAAGSANARPVGGAPETTPAPSSTKGKRPVIRFDNF